MPVCAPPIATDPAGTRVRGLAPRRVQRFVEAEQVRESRHEAKHRDAVIAICMPLDDSLFIDTGLRRDVAEVRSELAAVAHGNFEHRCFAADFCIGPGRFRFEKLRGDFADASRRQQMWRSRRIRKRGDVVMYAHARVRRSDIANAGKRSGPQHVGEGKRGTIGRGVDAVAEPDQQRAVAERLERESIHCGSSICSAARSEPSRRRTTSASNGTRSPTFQTGRGQAASLM